MKQLKLVNDVQLILIILAKDFETSISFEIKLVRGSWFSSMASTILSMFLSKYANTSISYNCTGKQKPWDTINTILSFHSHWGREFNLIDHQHCNSMREKNDFIQQYYGNKCRQSKPICIHIIKFYLQNTTIFPILFYS